VNEPSSLNLKRKTLKQRERERESERERERDSERASERQKESENARGGYDRYDYRFLSGFKIKSTSACSGT